MGFAEPSESPRTLVRSYRTVSPLPDPATPENRRPSAVCSLWHFPASRLDWALPSILPCGVRTFLGRVTPERVPGRGHPADSPPSPLSRSGVVRRPATSKRSLRRYLFHGQLGIGRA